MTDLCTANLSASVGDNKCMKVGIKDIAYLANYDEIDSFTYHATLPNVITNVVMKNDPSGSPYKMYELKGINNTNEMATETVKGKVYSLFAQSFNFVCNDMTREGLERMDELNNFKGIVIFGSTFGGTNGVDTYKILGVENGLFNDKITGSYKSKDGAWIINLKSMTDYEESKNQYIFDVGSKATTEARLAVLIA